MQDRPTVDELLEAVANFLTDDVMPATSGRINFHARVSANALQTVRRELRNEEEFLWREWEGLAALLGEAPQPRSLVDLRKAVEDRNHDLVAKINAGEVDEGKYRQRVLDHLKVITRDKLLVTNPGWLK